MAENGRNSWHPLSWYCSNCGHLVTAFRNSKGEFKIACPSCRAVMIRTKMSRRHEKIEIFAPEG